MGIYWNAVCDEKRELIDPGDINNLGMKDYAIAHPNHPFGPIVVFAMLHRWAYHVVRLQSDESMSDEVFKYKNVTEEVIAAYVDFYKEQAVTPTGLITPPEPIRYTGKLYPSKT